MEKEEKITVYRRLTVTILSALIGFFVTLISTALLMSGPLTFEMMGKIAAVGAIFFALFGYVFPKKMEKVLFVLTLFQ